MTRRAQAPPPPTDLRHLRSRPVGSINGWAKVDGDQKLAVNLPFRAWC
jgi:hypothetical protein